MLKRLANKSINMRTSTDSIRYAIWATGNICVVIDDMGDKNFDVWIEEGDNVLVEPIRYSDSELLKCIEEADKMLEEIHTEALKLGDTGLFVR